MFQTFLLKNHDPNLIISYFTIPLHPFCHFPFFFHPSSVLLPYILRSSFELFTYFPHYFSINSTLVLHRNDGQSMDNRWTISGQSPMSPRRMSEGRVEDETYSAAPAIKTSSVKKQVEAFAATLMV